MCCKSEDRKKIVLDVEDAISALPETAVPDDDDAIAAALKTLVLDQSLREAYGRKAKENSVRFSSRSMAEQYCDIYRK